MSTFEAENILVEFLSLRQWAKDNIMRREPTRIAARLSDITRRFSLGLTKLEDLTDAQLYIDKIKVIKEEHEMKIGVIDNFKPFYRDGEEDAVQSDLDPSEKSS